MPSSLSNHEFRWAQDNFINFIEKDNYQNGFLILKGMLAMKQELQSNKGDWKGYKPVKDWSWMKKNTVYLVTDGSEIFIINNFGLDDKFYYWGIRKLNWRDRMEDDWLEALIKKGPQFHIPVGWDWVRWASWRKFWRQEFQHSHDYSAGSVWVKGPIIPIIPLPYYLKDGFMNWTKNPLEE